VAWAFLRPIGLSKKHIGFSKLQLYRYKLDSKKLPEEYAKSFIPAVYYDFIWPGHEKY
jgi:jouberin